MKVLLIRGHLLLLTREREVMIICIEMTVGLSLQVVRMEVEMILGEAVENVDIDEIVLEGPEMIQEITKFKKKIGIK